MCYLSYSHDHQDVINHILIITIYIQLIIQGLTRQAGQLAACSLCRKDIPAGYLESAQVLTKVSRAMSY